MDDEAMDSEMDASWTQDAAGIVIHASQHYGGMRAWQRIRAIRLVPDRLTGFVPFMKGAGKTFALPSGLEIRPRERSTRLIGFPEEDHIGVFRDGAVWIENATTGALVARSDSHRHTFTGRAGSRRWRPMDALYFLGYAAAHYHALPFTLLQGRLLGMRTRYTAGTKTTALDVELPEQLHTHSRRQRFYFDPEGNLVRHDYVAEPVGPWAMGAHFWRRQIRVGGFLIALDRLVRVRLGSTSTPITALHLTFASADIELEGPAGSSPMV